LRWRLRTLEIEKAVEPLSIYAKDLGDDILVLTSNKQPVAAIVSLRNVDRESLLLSTAPEFMEIIEKSRAEFNLGRKLSLEEMKEEVATMR